MSERIERSERKYRSRSERSEKSQKSQRKDTSQKSEENKFIIPDSMKMENIPKENLSPFEEGTDFVILMQKLKQILLNKDTDWTFHLAVINYSCN